MIPYLALAVSPLIFLFIADLSHKTSLQSDEKTKKKYIFFCGAVLFLMIALRNNRVGSTDSANYYNNWKTLSKMSFANAKIFITDNKMEPGYLYSVWILSRVFVNPQWVFVFSGLLFAISVCRFIYLNSDNVVMSMVMYITLGLYTFMVQGLRQSIAMSICLFAIEHAKQRRPIRFFILIIIAYFFHHSSIVFALTYFLFWKKYTQITKIQILAAAAVILLATPLIVRYGNEIVDRDYGGTVDSGGFIFLAIYLIILLLALLFIPEKYEQASDRMLKKTVCNESFFLAMTAVGCCFYMMRYFGTQALERISFYFMFGQLITLPQVVRQLDGKSQKIAKAVIIVLCIALFAYRLRGSDLVPYRFFWQ